jgi:outer membrane protein TolC
MRRGTEVLRRILLILVVGGLWVATALAGEGPDAGHPRLKLDLMLAQTGASPPAASPRLGVMALSLRDTIALALKNNLDIAVEGFNPQIRRQGLIGEDAVFDPSAFLELTRSDTRAPGASVFFSGGRALSDLWDFNTGLRQKLPTGGTYELRFNNEYFNNRTASTGFSSRFGVSLSQPLLKNFGFEPNETNIRIATNNQNISREQLRLRVSTVTTQVKSSYFDLIFTRENLEVQRRSLRLAQELVALNRARVRAGVAAPVEVTQAEAQEAARVQDVILAEKSMRDAEDSLKVIMNLPASSGGWDQQIQPTDSPSSEVRPLNPEVAIQTALENRYEYKSAKLDVENKELSVRLTRNQLLPDLSMTGNVFTNGAGKVYGADLSELGSSHFISYSLGVVLTVPLGNRAAQASYMQSKLTLDQTKTSLRNLELQISQQVRQAIRQVEANAKRIDANRAARVLAEEQLRVEQRRLEAGVTTTFNVLSFQRDLAAAQANEIAAISDYNKSMATLDNVMGTVLERNKIEM